MLVHEKVKQKKKAVDVTTPTWRTLIVDLREKTEERVQAEAWLAD